MDAKAELKARIEERGKDLIHYLLHYRTLVANGFPKRVLDAEIRELEEELKELGRWH